MTGDFSIGAMPRRRNWSQAAEIYRTAVAAYRRMLEVRRTTGLSPLGSVQNASIHGMRRVPSVAFNCLDELTPREHEVATLLAQGYSNKQIAQTLVLTQGTVANHVAHILSKLGVTNRTQVAALVLGRTDEETESGSVVQLPSRPATASEQARMRWSPSQISARRVGPSR